MENQIALPKEVEMKITHNDLIDYVINKETERLKPELAAAEKALNAFQNKHNSEEIILNDAKSKHKQLIKDQKPKWYKLVRNTRSHETSDAILDFIEGQRFQNMYEAGPGLFNKSSYNLHTFEFLFVTDKFIVKYTPPVALMKQVDELGKEEKRLSNHVAEIKQKIHDVKNGAYLIKGKLTEQILMSSVEGEELKKKLDSITFSKLLGA